MLLGKCFARLGCGFIWLLASMTGIATAGCTDSIVEIKSAHAHIRLNVEVADSAEERAIGLMHRQSMPYNSGMWFIYETPRTVAFWMRNTLIPLDIIFVDQHGEVQKIHMNALFTFTVTVTTNQLHTHFRNDVPFTTKEVSPLLIEY